MKPDPDYNIARTAFIEGRNHPADIDAMMTLFRRFRDLGPIKQSVFLWERADTHIDDLAAIGHELYKAGPSLTPAERAQHIQRVSRLNVTLNGH